MSLRIVAGSRKRRLIDEVPGVTTRPTTDRNRESLFNILGQYFEGGFALDLCAGTGALGIECLSRGMTHVTFVELSPIAIRVLKSNLQKLSLETQSTVHGIDALRFLQTTEQTFDCILADPPYQAELYEDIVRVIGERELLAEQGTLVLEADKSSTFASTPDLTLFDVRIMGNTQFVFFRRRTAL
jgi:16S rRNA (guanine(966)-N(2))-methyltransferase RsmD